jgi:hypothetical protein
MTEPLREPITGEQGPLDQFFPAANPLRGTQEGTRDVLAEVASSVGVEAIAD